ncbi:MAG: HD domain-containing protein, partial [Massilia sp.]
MTLNTLDGPHPGTPAAPAEPATAGTPPSRSSRAAARQDALASAAAAAPAPVASVTHLVNRLSEYLSPSELKKVKEAYRFSDEMHLGQVRKSGEPYIIHPIAVAEICADWKLDAQAIMAAFLHDVMEDQDVKKEELIERFGAPVANLVDGLSKLEKIEFQSLIEAQAENFRKMLLAMASDVRVILIKLADRLHNMRTIDALPKQKQQEKARETLEIFAPLAHRLGIHAIKWELEDLSFAALYPKRHEEINRLVGEHAPQRDALLGNVTSRVIVD